MKTFLVGLMVFVFHLVPAQQMTLNEIREKYVKAAEDEDAAEELFKYLESKTENEPVLYAYRGAATALMAKYAFLPHKKLSYVHKSMEILKAAVQKDNENIEIRYLRLSIQYNIPSFLGYKENLDEDKKQIYKNINLAEKFSLSKEFLKDMVKYLISTDLYTEDEKQFLKKAAGI